MTTVGSDMAAPEMVEVADGVELALHCLGGDGPPLLFVHATGFNGRVYGPLASRLVEHFTVWAPDLRAHGWSPPPADRDYLWTTLADDLLAIVDHLGIAAGELDCVGHSIGAATLLLADARRPSTIRRMYGYEPVVWRVEDKFGPGENPLAEFTHKRRETFASRGEAFERYAPRPPFGTMRADALASYVANGFEDLPDGTIRLRCRAADEAATYDGEWVSTTALLDGSQTRVAIGRGLQLPPREDADIGVPAHEALANSWLIEYPQLSHFGPFEDPDLIAADALEALSGRLGAGAQAETNSAR
ncbi:alpha/beta fold hydrolase [Candidatus Poriferisodalis sp.]|uniref:alpha/beta fold hydrolase n=1 Tax=Candidatus Poriferisodalis sp. TaxID=3101277 RepID=UPI003B02E404